MSIENEHELMFTIDKRAGLRYNMPEIILRFEHKEIRVVSDDERKSNPEAGEIFGSTITEVAHTTRRGRL